MFAFHLKPSLSLIFQVMIFQDMICHVLCLSRTLIFSRHDGVCHVVPLLIGMTFVYELASLFFHVIAVTCIVFPHVGVTFVYGLSFVH